MESHFPALPIRFSVKPLRLWMEEVEAEAEAGARMGLRLLRRSPSSTPPSRVEQIEKFLRSGISFVRMARGAAYPPQSRRRASEKRSYQSCEGVSRTEGTVFVIAYKSGSCASSVRRLFSSETIFASTNSSPPVPIRNGPPHSSPISELPASLSCVDI